MYFPEHFPTCNTWGLYFGLMELDFNKPITTRGRYAQPLQRVEGVLKEELPHTLHGNKNGGGIITGF